MTPLFWLVSVKLSSRLSSLAMVGHPTSLVKASMDPCTGKWRAHLSTVSHKYVITSTKHGTQVKRFVRDDPWLYFELAKDGQHQKGCNTAI
jgi:hypothetical protein